jgi:polyribonucleotide nucleotidyltransferase
MIDASANRLSDEKFFSALQFSVECCLPIIDQIKNLSSKTKRTNIELQKFDQSLIEKITTLSSDRLLKIFTDSTLDKIARDTAVNLLRQDILNELITKEHIPPINLPDTFTYVVKKIFRNLILEKSHRCDGRSFDQLRPINCQVDLYKPLHGSDLFQRGHKFYVQWHSMHLIHNIDFMILHGEQELNVNHLFFIMNFHHMQRMKLVERTEELTGGN